MWKVEYFNYWLTHWFYFTAGLIIIFAIGKNKWDDYQFKLKLLEGLRKETENGFRIHDAL